MVLDIVAALWLLSPPAVPQPQASHWSEAARRVVLDNGLTVLMLQRGELPVVSVEALYRFGSRNESPGVTGGAHFLEHMAFRSTDEIAKQDLTNEILRLGGRWNGYTSYDQTVYASATPSVYLEWLLYLESQRLRHVRFDPAEVDLERTSVLAEEHGYRNDPAYVMAEHRLRRVALVAHPYGSPIMGRMSDLVGITAPELERLYRDHYAPNNLVLAIVGRFDEELALQYVSKYFSSVPGNGRSTKLRTVEPLQDGPRRIAMYAPASSAHLEMLVQAPAAGDDAFATLLVLDGVLAGGKAPGRQEARPGSRLHRALVESGLATSVSTEVELAEYPGLYAIGVDAPPDRDRDAIEAALDAAITEAAATSAPEEVARAAADVQGALAFGADSNRSIADLLAVYEEMGSFHLLGLLPRRVAAVTATAVREFARTRLAPERRSIGWLIPQSASGAGPEPETAAPASPPPSGQAARRRSTRPLPAPRLEVPALPQPTVRRLTNGLQALALRVPGQAMNVRLRVEAGAVDDPEGREGTALLAARLLSPDSALSLQQVRLVESAFDSEDPFANRSGVEIAVSFFPADLDGVMRALAASLAKPAFEPEAVSRARQSLAAESESHRTDSRWRADRALFERMYAGGPPYGRPPEGTTDSLARISIDDLATFHRRYYRPERTVVAVAGPMDAADALDAVARAFGGWPGSPEPPLPAAASVPSPPQSGQVDIRLDKAQASIAVGLPGISHDSPDLPALAALNYLLGETGYAGRLGETLVDTGIAYAVYASVLADRQPGPIFITTDAVRSTEAVDRILDTLGGFAKGGVSDAELTEAKGYLLGRLLFRFESPQAAARTLCELGTFGAPDALQTFARQVLALRTAEVDVVARRYYDPARAVVVVAGR